MSISPIGVTKWESTCIKTDHERGQPGQSPTVLKLEQLDMVASCMTEGTSRERSGMIMRSEVGRNGDGSRMGCRVGGKGYMRVARLGREHRTQRREDGSREMQVLGTSVAEHIWVCFFSLTSCNSL